VSGTPSTLPPPPPVPSGGRSRCPRGFAELLADLLARFFDGRNASVGDGVERALGRKPRDFAEWVSETAATGVWNGA
jgi:hypothetical protein